MCTATSPTEESYDQKALHSINSLQSFAQPYKVKVTYWNKLQAAAAKSLWQAARSMCTATSPTKESCDQKALHSINSLQSFA
ncbi:hypothetical protein ACFX2A_036734 [Malus domestica]